jgi:hypothetical protein
MTSSLRRERNREHLGYPPTGGRKAPVRPKPQRLYRLAVSPRVSTNHKLS